ncbi:hypothetical protein HID58_042125 [Brassica napus]|uniref:Uncharacterized protein n=1 Tax=Brassica napus TaxID=3708 RepID=A0ABQ8BCU0_BRANA|nr:hypothetical protein HID58_042125 [Brassica napus]
MIPIMIHFKIFLNKKHTILFLEKSLVAPYSRLSWPTLNYPISLLLSETKAT